MRCPLKKAQMERVLKEKVKSVNYSKYVFLGITFGIILNNFI